MTGGPIPFEALRARLRLTEQEMQQLTGGAQGAVRARLAELAELEDLLRRLFSGPDLARDWLRDSRPEMLGGDTTPLETMLAGCIDRVLLVLNHLARGA